MGDDADFVSLLARAPDLASEHSRAAKEDPPEDSRRFVRPSCRSFPVDGSRHGAVAGNSGANVFILCFGEQPPERVEIVTFFPELPGVFREVVKSPGREVAVCGAPGRAMARTLGIAPTSAPILPDDVVSDHRRTKDSRQGEEKDSRHGEVTTRVS